MEYKLYGDGIHDDYPAIQAMLDEGEGCVYLPAPKAFYKISRCLKIHSDQELRLDKFTVVRLADAANCCMLENANPEHYDKNICVNGGVWDMNHNRQWPNPYHFDNPDTGETAESRMEKFLADRHNRLFSDDYSGHCFRFNSIKNFTLKNVTIKNPVVYGCQMAHIEHFTIENITFDYTEGSPKLWNLDGIHLEGGCRNGYIRNLQGACHDDLLAITADDGKFGIIENITVNGIIAEGCHSAVRLLSWHIPVRNVHISDIFGTFYVYCITLSKYYAKNESRGLFENISIDNVCASFSKGTQDVPGNYGPLIDIGSELDINNLSINGLVRNENICFEPTIGIGENTKINHMLISNCVQTCPENAKAEFLECKGEIKSGKLQDITVNGETIFDKNFG